LLRNEEANDCYVQGNYRHAAELYENAIKFDPTDPVIHSNLGGAWEQVREPERRMEALNKAIAAFRGAQNINASPKYDKKIDRLEQKKNFASLYGEKPLDWLHVVTPIAVEVASNLVRYIEGSAPGTLSEELLEHATLMRERVE